MTVFIHTGDWQIGKPFGAVTDETKRFQLQRARIDAIGRIREAALRHQANTVLVAGDLFDAEAVPTSLLMEVLQAIGEFEIPVLVIPGNHDHGAPGTLWHREAFQRYQAELAPNLQVLLRPEPVELDHLVLLPCPLLRRHEATDPTAWVRALNWAALPAHKPRVLMAHGSVQGFGGALMPAEGEDPASTTNRIDLTALPPGQIDYIALGDWHNLKQVASQGAPAEAWYAGTPEPDRFDRGEDNQRAQVLVVELQRAQAPSVQLQRTGRLQWHRLEINFSSDRDLEHLERQLDARLEQRVARDLLNLKVSGSLSLAAYQRYQRLLSDLQARLLRLKLEGRCDQAPQAEELAALTERPDDPLIARIAVQLHTQLQALEPDGPQDEEAAVIRLALSELYRLSTATG